MQSRGNAGDPRGAHHLAVFLEVNEEKRLVSFNRPADRATELVLVERRPRIADAVLEEVVGIQIPVAEELIKRAVQLIRAGLDADADYGARGSPVFSRELISLGAELLRGVRGRNE